MNFFPLRNIGESILCTVLIVIMTLMSWILFGVAFEEGILKHKDVLSFWIPLLSSASGALIALFVAVIYTSQTLKKQKIDICENRIKVANAEIRYLAEDLCIQIKKLLRVIQIIRNNENKIQYTQFNELAEVLQTFDESKDKLLEMYAFIEEGQPNQYNMKLYNVVKEILVLFENMYTFRPAEVQVLTDSQISYITGRCGEVIAISADLLNVLTKIRDRYARQYVVLTNALF